MQAAPSQAIAFYDTHVHFHELLESAGTLPEIIARASAASVTRMLAVGGSPETNRQALQAALAYPEQLRAALGLNRDQAGLAYASAELAAQLAAPQVVAVGEIGLDFQHARPEHAAQGKLLERMLELARAQGLPVIIHSRAAEAATLELLERHVQQWRGAADRVGVQHCFTGSRAYAERLLELGFYISFSGIITFKNAGALRAIAAQIPAERLLIETDAPWLSPEPLRGKPNEPARVGLVAAALAAARGCSLPEIASLTSQNAQRLFGW